MKINLYSMTLIVLLHFSLLHGMDSPSPQYKEKFGGITLGATQLELKSKPKSDFNSKREALYISFKKGNYWYSESSWLPFFFIDGSIGGNDRNSLYSIGTGLGLGYHFDKLIYFVGIGAEGLNLLIPDLSMDQYNAWGGAIQTSIFLEIRSGFGLEVGYKRGYYKSKVNPSLDFSSNRWMINLAYYDFKL